MFFVLSSIFHAKKESNKPHDKNKKYFPHPLELSALSTDRCCVGRALIYNKQKKMALYFLENIDQNVLLFFIWNYLVFTFKIFLVAWETKTICLHQDFTAKAVGIIDPSSNQIIQKSDNLQYNTVGQLDDAMIVPPSDGPMLILIDWK